MREYTKEVALSRCTTNGDMRKAVKLYKNKGFALVNPILPPKQKHTPGEKQKITTWTSSARRRMRQFMIANTCPPSWFTFGVTLTIPGYPLTTRETKRLFNLFTQYSQRQQIKFACVWRMEIQKRGSIHWHLIAITDNNNPATITHELKICWIKCLKALGEVEEHYMGDIEAPELLDDLREDSGARVKHFDYWAKWGKHYKAETLPKQHKNGKIYPVKYKNIIYDKACDVIIFEDQTHGHWLRYMNDHATKRKQEQIAEGVGKHWGYINKKAFIQDKPKTFYFEDNPEEYYKLLRWLNRLMTPIILEKTALFGRKKGKHWGNLQSNGTKNYFSNPETAQKMIDLIKNEYKPITTRGTFSAKTCNTLKINKRKYYPNKKALIKHTKTTINKGEHLATITPTQQAEALAN